MTSVFPVCTIFIEIGDEKQTVHLAREPERSRQRLPTNRWITATDTTCAREECNTSRGVARKSAQFANVPGQFYDLIQWMREGCGRERGQPWKRETRRLHGIPGCTLRDEFPRVYRRHGNRESEKSLRLTANSRYNGKRTRPRSNFRVDPVAALRFTSHAVIGGGCIAIRQNKIPIRIYIGNLINSERTVVLL